MQARYYDPVIGRFYSNDPIGFRDIHSFNRYTYANNNPYKYIDPDGQAVEIAASLRKAYNKAKAYLIAKSPTAKARFARLESRHTETVLIEPTNKETDSLVGHNRKLDVINWNPKGAIMTEAGGQSPATGLIHEIIHVQNSQDGFEGTEEEEYRSTILSENVINSETGEPQRRDHGDGSPPIPVSEPTCRPTKDGEVCG